MSVPTASFAAGGLHALSATSLRHPLASKRFVIEFDTPPPKRMEPFELLSRYTAETPLARGTYGLVVAARDAELVEAFTQLPEEEQNPPEGEGNSDEPSEDPKVRFDRKTLCAVKKIPRLFSEGIPRLWLCAAREAQMLLHFSHPNVISATDLFIPLGEAKMLTLSAIEERKNAFDELYLVMEKKDYTLRQVLDSVTQRDEAGNAVLCPFTRQPIAALEHDYRQFLLYQLLCGVSYLHDCQVMHRDLKPENVLVDCEYKASICDFGQARDMSLASAAEEEEVLGGSEGGGASDGAPDMRNASCETVMDNCTQWYAAPETLTLSTAGRLGATGFLDSDVVHSADVWSVGAIAAEMILGRPVFFTSHRGGSAQLSAIVAAMGPISESDAEVLARGRQEDDRTTLQSIFLTSSRRMGSSAVRRASTAAPLLAELLREHCPHKDTTDEEIDLILQLLKYNPSSRLRPSDAIRHPFFTNAGYDTDSIPQGNVRPLRTVPKADLESEEQARGFLWDLFISRHPEVEQLLEILRHQAVKTAAAQSTST